MSAVEATSESGAPRRRTMVCAAMLGLLAALALAPHARAEDAMFPAKLWGEPVSEPWRSAPWDDYPDWDFTSAAHDSPQDLYALWAGTVARSRASVQRALATGGLDHPAHIGWGGEQASLRRLLFDLVEEYGRHTGHADLLREAADGVTGEDPPSGMPWPDPLG